MSGAVSSNSNKAGASYQLASNGASAQGTCARMRGCWLIPDARAPGPVANRRGLLAAVNCRVLFSEGRGACVFWR